MKFGVIYSVDVAGKHIKGLSPCTKQPGIWNKTEGDEEYEYSYLGGAWERGKHGKYYALLNKKQFKDFIEQMSLYPEDVETGGSLGCPTPDGGFCYSFLPAISFNGSGYDCILNAYVTPFPEVKGKSTPFTERDFKRIKRVIMEMYY